MFLQMLNRQLRNKKSDKMQMEKSRAFRTTYRIFNICLEHNNIGIDGIMAMRTCSWRTLINLFGSIDDMILSVETNSQKAIINDSLFLNTEPNDLEGFRAERRK